MCIRDRSCSLNCATIAKFSTRSAEKPVILSSECRRYRGFSTWARGKTNAFFVSLFVVLGVDFGGILEALGTILVTLPPPGRHCGDPGGHRGPKLEKVTKTWFVGRSRVPLVGTISAQKMTKSMKKWSRRSAWDGIAGCSGKRPKSVVILEGRTCIPTTPAQSKRGFRV